MKRNKHSRLASLRRILKEESVPNQQALIGRLAREGFSVSQATLSRDLKELGGFRRATNTGDFAYTLPGPEETVCSEDALGRAAREFITDMVLVGNFLVIRTLPGNAQSLCVILDQVNMDEVVGTIAGDDTILVIARSDKDMKRVSEILDRLRN